MSWPRPAGGEDELARDDGDEARRLTASLTPVKRCGAAAGSFSRSAVASGPMRCTRATLVSTRGMRSRPFSVAMIIATIAVATPISTIRALRQAEDRDHHRIEDEDRHRVVGREERIERPPQPAAAHGCTTPSAKPTIDRRGSRAMTTTARVWRMSALILPAASSLTSAAAISEGGIMTRWCDRTRPAQRARATPKQADDEPQA